jgi:phage terminase small subunit
MVIDARGPSIGPSVAEILAVGEQGIVLLNPETGHAHKNPLLAAAEVAGRDLLRFASHFGLTPVAEVSLGKPLAPDSDDDDPFGS